MTKFAPRDVMHDPALGSSVVFRPLRKSTHRQKLDVTTRWGELEIQWRGPDALGIGDQSVLFAVLEVAREALLQARQEAVVGADDPLWVQLQHENHVFRADTVSVTTSLTSLAQRCFWGDGGTALKRVRVALRRLTETTVWVRHLKLEGSSRLLAWHVGNEKHVCLAVNWRLAEALNGEGYAWVSLHERAQLQDEPTQALHAMLSSRLRKGCSWSCSVDKLQRHVWGDTVDGANLRSRRVKLLKGLHAIGQLPKWAIQVDERAIAKVSRLKTDKDAHAAPSYQTRHVASATTRRIAHMGPSQRCAAEAQKPSIDAGFETIDASVLFL